MLLEDSIERILSVLQEESQGDSEEPGESSSDQPGGNANAMNRSIIRSWTPKNQTQNEHGAVPNNTSEITNAQMNVVALSHGGTSNSLQNDAGIRPDGDTSTKKRMNQARPFAGERPPKRSKVAIPPSVTTPSSTTLADIGGMDSVIEAFKEYVLLPLMRPQRYVRRGLKIPRGILLHGPPGTGKTILCEAVANQMGLPFLRVSAPSIVAGMSGESEKALRQLFENAVQMAPCLIFIDEIDAIAGKRETSQREMEKRIVGQLLTCMDDLALEKTGGKPVIVLAATNRPDSLDHALRRAGRFDTEINIGVPNPAAREKILRAQTRKTPMSEDVDFIELANMTAGYVGADLESLVSKAGSVTDARYRQALESLSMEGDNDTDMDDTTTEDQTAGTPQNLGPAAASFIRMQKLLSDQREPEDFEDDPITMADFRKAFTLVQPSSKREGFATVPETTWSHIGALRDVRKQLHRAIVEPILKPARYARFSISVPAGVLLWGPPGCGKTLLAMAVANESKAAFISVKGPELLNKYVGESERAVRQLFFRARSSIPCVIFFDELDALVPRRDGDSMSEASARVVNTLLTELDGISSRTGIYVIAATNRPDMIDTAMLRPGRLGKHIFVGLPGAEERVEILSTILSAKPAKPELAGFAVRCEGFSGADLSYLAHEAASNAVARDAVGEEDELILADLEGAFAGMKPSVGDMEKYERLNKRGLTSR